MTCFNKGAEVEPGNFFVYINRGFLHEKQNNLPQALADFTKAIELRPTDPDAFESRARIYLALKMKKKAGADEEKAKKLKSHSGNKKSKPNDMP